MRSRAHCQESADRVVFTGIAILDVEEIARRAGDFVRRQGPDSRLSAEDRDGKGRIRL